MRVCIERLVNELEPEGNDLNAKVGVLVRKGLRVQAAAAHGFIGPRPLGRGMKMDRQEIAGLVVAVEDWINTDHEERLVSYGARFSVTHARTSGQGNVPKRA